MKKILQENNIEVAEMTILNTENKLNLLLKTCSGGALSTMEFKNVSRINIKDLSLSLTLSGIEIIDHFEDGWDVGSRYEIRDYEDGRISFFCESFTEPEVLL